MILEFSSAIITLAGFALGLAPSLFVVRPTVAQQKGELCFSALHINNPNSTDVSIKSANNIGLDPDWVNLAPFVAAAGVRALF